MSDAAAAFEQLLRAFEELEIFYMIGGSLASSVSGVWRSTQDIDIIADIMPNKVEDLARSLSPAYYADAQAMREAIERNRPFNIIHYRTGSKFDVFPLSPDPWNQAEFARRIRTELQIEGRTLSLPVATPEDIILAKLVWYQKGGGISDRQWSDIRGVISVQKGRLEADYLRHWARHLGVSDLLVRAIEE